MNSKNDIDNEQISVLKTVNELHQKNKLAKINVWEYDYIDAFESLAQNRPNHSYISNFQNICRSMDTMVKIFELRVDSVSLDVFRIANRRHSSPNHSIKELIEIDQRHVDVHEDIPIQKNIKTNRRQWKRRNNNSRATVATKTQLNAPLKMLSSIPDPIISKIHQIDGEIGKANCMLSNLFSTGGKSNFSICGNLRFFDKSQAERVDFEKNNDYNVPGDNFFHLPIKINSEFMPIRPTRSGYVLNETLNDNEYEYCESIAPSFANELDNFTFNFDDMEQGEFCYDATPDINMDDATINDENDDPPNNIQPSHPSLEELSKGEYSYFNGIKNFAHGPSFWRFEKKGKHPNSNDNNESIPKPAKSRRKKNHRMTPFTTNDDSQHVNNFDEVQQFTNSPNTSQFDEMPPFNINIDEQTNIEAPEGEIQADISQLYTDGPVEVEQINIKFNNLPRQINMKNIDTATLSSIKQQFERSIDSPVNIYGDEEFEKGYATFANTHRSLVKQFKDIASPSISLLSLLHNTNDHRFKLDRQPIENTNNFNIRQLKEN